jgi:Protein NO VEIN, C-terminal
MRERCRGGSRNFFAGSMAVESKIGTAWRDAELDAIIDDYFAMLAAELDGRPYVKSKHSKALMARIGRTHRSVEFKHQNISAVLDELGMPWIPGYKPKRNYQYGIFDAIDRYLTKHPDVLGRVPTRLPAVGDEVFVTAPTLVKAIEPSPGGLRRLVRKFDPVERDHRNRSLGKAGEEFVINVERVRLTAADRNDLARKVRWVAAEDGDGAGYDVLSFDFSGRERLLEVKTTNGAARTPFYLTRNECALAAEHPVEWCVYRVHLFATEPHIFTIAPPLQKALNLRPEAWRASF